MTTDSKRAPGPAPISPAPAFGEPALPAKAPERKERKPPPKVREAIHLLCYGQAKTVKSAAEKVGLTRERLSRALSEPHIAEYLRTRAARTVGLASGRAAARLNELIDSTSQKVALDAAKFALGVAGIKPAADNVSVNIGLEIKAGYVIDLSERDDPSVAKLVNGTAIETKPVD